MLIRLDPLVVVTAFDGDSGRAYTTVTGALHFRRVARTPSWSSASVWSKFKIEAHAGSRWHRTREQYERDVWLRIGCTQQSLVWWAGPRGAQFVGEMGGMSARRLNAMRYGFVCTVAALLGVGAPPMPRTRR